MSDPAVEELRIVGGETTLEGHQPTAAAAAAGLAVRWLEFAIAEAQRVSRRARTPEINCEPVTTASGPSPAGLANFGARPAYMSVESPKFRLDRSSNCVLPTMAPVCATASLRPRSSPKTPRPSDCRS